jgi:site-specific recombinase XerD
MEAKNHTFGIVFYLRKYKTNRGKAPIYMRITVNGKRADLSIKRSIDQESWNVHKGLAKGNKAEMQALNLYLEKVRAKIVHHYQEMTLTGKMITAAAIKNKFLGVDRQEYTLNKLMEYHNNQMVMVIAAGTMKNYYTTQKYLKRFLLQEVKANDTPLSEIDYKFVTEFELFLRAWKPVDHQRPLKNNGVMKHMERFHKMINLAKKLEWMNNDPFFNYRLKFEKVERGFLTQNELLSIEAEEFKIDRLKQVRDLFVFSCYTGLSYIDVVNLTPESVALGIDGTKWIFTKRQKSSEEVQVPLLPKALAIIEKYKDNPKVVHEEKLLPGMSNQKINSYLKEIAGLCGIEKNLTFHLARHTFATTVTLMNGVPIESISKMLGHTKLSTTQIYAKVVESKLSHDMMELKSKLENSGLTETSCPKSN